MDLSVLQEIVGWRDLLDVAIVTLIIYYVLLLIRGTRAVQMVVGMLLAVGAYYIARILRLVTLETILENFFIFLPFAIIVLFQHEIRRALAKFGRNALWGRPANEDVEAAFNEVVLATVAMASRRTGALIVIERAVGLRNFAENGIEIDSRLSLDLLMNIFHPGTPLHDGAVILQGDRIAAASCFLPLTLNPELSTELGTRHRAALGITEETDALAIVVSEETGTISVAHDGKLRRGLDTQELRNMLFKGLLGELPSNGGGAP